MKTIYEFTAITLIIFGLCFAISTLSYNERDLAIGEIKVVRHGFPMAWLKATTIILPPSPTQYAVLWFELFIDIFLYLALSSVISFIIIKAKQQREAPSKRS